MTLRERFPDIDSDLARLGTVWLSGILTGELIIVFALATTREFRPLSGTTDWIVAIGLAALAVAILVIALRDEFTEA